MTERHLDLLQKHRELQKAFDDTLEMNRKLGSENWKFEKENEQLKQQIEKMKRCENCVNEDYDEDEEPCRSCLNRSKWELAE